MTFFIAYLRCISSLHIFIAYLHCISALHIFTAYLHCIYSLHLHCISSLLIFNAQLRRKVLKTITYFSKINRRVTILMKVLVVFYQKRKSLQKPLRFSSKSQKKLHFWWESLWFFEKKKRIFVSLSLRFIWKIVKTDHF